MEIKLKLNDFDYIVIDDYHNGGINFRMYSKDSMGKTRVFNDGCTQKMGISERNIDSFIKSLQDIRKLMQLEKEKNEQ